MKTLFILAAFASAVAVAFASELPKEVTEARARYEIAQAAASKPVTDRYVAELEQIKSRAMTTNNLDLAKAADGQAKNPTTAPAGAELPKDLTEVRKRYEAALSVAIKPVRDRYVAELQQIRRSAMSMKNLELAAAADAEAKRVTTNLAEQSAAVVGTWKLAFDNATSTAHVTRDGKCAMANGSDSGKWTIEGDYVVLHWGNGWKNRFPIFAGRGKRTGESKKPGGSNWISEHFTPTKVK